MTVALSLLGYRQIGHPAAIVDTSGRGKAAPRLSHRLQIKPMRGISVCRTFVRILAHKVKKRRSMAALFTKSLARLNFRSFGHIRLAFTF